MSVSAQFAIALYVPDPTLRALNERGGLRGLILEGVPELEFLPPPGWWERSHAARLGLIISDGTKEPGFGGSREAAICAE